MGLEIVIFIGAILFGILLYWRESNGNKVYRLLNKIVNSKELQMKPDDKTGFIYQQKLLLRIVYVTAFFLLLAVIVQFFTPFKIFGSYNGTSVFASMIVGTLIGTYIASFVIKSGEVIEDKTDNLGGIVKDVVEKGKELVDDVKEKASDLVEDVKGKEDVVEEESSLKTPLKEDDGKSARERLKDKGLL